MKNTALLFFCLVAFFVHAQDAPFSWELKEHKFDSEKSLNQSGWSIVVKSKAKEPISIGWIVNNPKPSNDGSKVTPPSGSIELEPGAEEETFEFFCGYGVQPDAKVWMKAGMTSTSGKSPESKEGKEAPNATSPSPTVNDGGAILEKAIQDAVKKRLAEEKGGVIGEWVVKSGPKIGTITSDGHFGIKGEKVKYLITFREDGTGSYWIDQQNKVDHAGGRTSYTYKRDIKYSIKGSTILVEIGPSEIISGDLGPWILPDKSENFKWTINGDSIDMGGKFIIRKL